MSFSCKWVEMKLKEMNWIEINEKVFFLHTYISRSLTHVLINVCACFISQTYIIMCKSKERERNIYTCMFYVYIFSHWVSEYLKPVATCHKASATWLYDFCCMHMHINCIIEIHSHLDLMSSINISYGVIVYSVGVWWKLIFFSLTPRRSSSTTCIQNLA